MTALCEACKPNQAILMMTKVDSLSQAAELVCVHCCYERASNAPIGAYVLQRMVKDGQSG
jgi:protein-arginine kinase activator protein McsA